MIIYKILGPGRQFQCFGENLVIFCKLSTLIHVTSGQSHPYHLDDSTLNYRGHQESHFVLSSVSMKKHRRDGASVVIFWGGGLCTVNARQVYMG